MPASAWIARAAPILLLGAVAIAPPPAPAQVRIPPVINPSAGSAHDASMDDYRRHLTALSAIVTACAKARDTATCDPSLVGQDDVVPLAASDHRLIRYDWLRALLLKARIKDDPEPQPKEQAAKPPQNPKDGKDAASQKNDDGDEDVPVLKLQLRPKRSSTELLQDAQARLARDLAQASQPPTSFAAHDAGHAALARVLARHEFRDLGEVSTRDSLLERIANWLNRFFGKALTIGSRASWIGRVIVYGLLGGVCIALVLGLIQLERRRRIRLIPEQTGPAPGAASARDWQLWLEDARRAAAEGRWREAVHFVYWASISRLESRRLWPADRARTPREYLALVAEEDPRRPGLKSLTGSFERIWYGGREAGETEYRAAEQLAQALISSGGGA